MAVGSHELDREVLAAEEDARNYNRRSHEIERVASASSASTSSSGGSLRARPTGMSRMPTQRDLERHPTELDRIQTARSQHSATVAASLGRSNTQTRDAKRPMPSMGGGKPLPPRYNVDDYVVECQYAPRVEIKRFWWLTLELAVVDGPDDPLHAQNWPLKKK